jgi:uncharacterized PurR-regulated membrane protein YhhQ (DUF165 family)
MILVALYLSAVVVANLLVTAYGPSATIPAALVLVSLTLTARDVLHDRWTGRALSLRLGALIAAGSILSYLLNAKAAQIAIASCAAFAASEAVDALVYHALRRRPVLARTNASNVAGALVDSVIFPTLAFGIFLPWVIAGQAAAKVVGGFAYSLLRRQRRAVVVAGACCAIFAAPASAQVLTVGIASVTTEFDTVPIAEVLAVTPSWRGFSVAGIGSVQESGDVDAFLKVGRALPAPKGMLLGIEAGADFLSFRGHKAEPMVGVYAVKLLPHRFAIRGAVSAEPERDWGWAAVLKIDYALMVPR